jgi:hypothetical protein
MLHWALASLALGAAALVAVAAGSPVNKQLWTPSYCLATAALCAEIHHWFGGSPPNFRTLSLGQIEVDSADFWTDRLLSSSSRSTADNLLSNHSNTRTLKSG